VGVEERNVDAKRVADWYDMTGRVVAVTGGAGVLGGEIAVALVGCGADVALLDVEPAGAERFHDRLEDGRGRWMVAACDVLDSGSLEDASRQTTAKMGPVDTLVNAAGGNSPTATTGPERSFFDLPEEALRFVTDLNLLGTVLPCQVFGRAMADRKRGVILNVCSMNALRPLTQIPAYSAAKAAVANFTQWLAVHMAREYSPEIRVNAVAPGFFMTPQNRFLLSEEASGQLTPRGTAIIEHTPMRRFGQPEDLLGTALWLLSPASSFVTGVIVPVDGGFSAYAGV
jgi:NAD(P)-dependent dehydrogenase (short-subunit alcohol dehydrogenase family)